LISLLSSVNKQQNKTHPHRLILIDNIFHSCKQSVDKTQCY